MKKKNIAFMMVVLVTVMMLFAGTATALTDSDFSVSFDATQGNTQSDVDIIHVETEKVGDNVTFTIEVDGEIKDTSGYSYVFQVSETESKSDTSVTISYSSGVATYVATHGSGGSSGVPTSDVSGGTLTLEVPVSIFDPMNSFYVAGYASDGESALDWALEWEDSGSGEDDTGDTSNDSDTYDNETAENLIEQYILGSMLCIALAVIIPIVIIVIIIVVVLKVLSGGDEGGGQQSQQQRQQPPQQQQTPSGQQKGQQPPPPGQSGSGQNPPPPEDESGDEW